VCFLATSYSPLVRFHPLTKLATANYNAALIADCGSIERYWNNHRVRILQVQTMSSTTPPSPPEMVAFDGVVKHHLTSAGCAYSKSELATLQRQKSKTSSKFKYRHKSAVLVEKAPHEEERWDVPDMKAVDRRQDDGREETYSHFHDMVGNRRVNGKNDDEARDHNARDESQRKNSTSSSGNSRNQLFFRKIIQAGRIIAKKQVVEESVDDPSETMRKKEYQDLLTVTISENINTRQQSNRANKVNKFNITSKLHQQEPTPSALIRGSSTQTGVAIDTITIEAKRESSDLHLHSRISSLGEGSGWREEEDEDEEESDESSRSASNKASSSSSSYSSSSYDDSAISYYSETDGGGNDDHDHSMFSDGSSYITGYYTYGGDDDEDDTLGVSTRAASFVSKPFSLGRFGRYLSKTGSALVDLVPATAGYYDRAFSFRDDHCEPDERKDEDRRDGPPSVVPRDDSSSHESMASADAEKGGSCVSSVQQPYPEDKAGQMTGLEQELSFNTETPIVKNPSFPSSVQSTVTSAKKNGSIHMPKIFGRRNHNGTANDVKQPDGNESFHRIDGTEEAEIDQQDFRRERSTVSRTSGLPQNYSGKNGSVGDDCSFDDHLPPLRDDYSVFDQGFEVVAQVEPKPQGSTSRNGQNTGNAEPDVSRDTRDSNNSPEIPDTNDDDNELPPLSSDLSVFDQGFEVVALMDAITREEPIDPAYTNIDQDELTTASAMSWQDRSGHNNESAIVVQVSADLSQDLSMTENDFVETQLPSSMQYLEPIAEAKNENAPSAASRSTMSDCLASSRSHHRGAGIHACSEKGDVPIVRDGQSTISKFGVEATLDGFHNISSHECIMVSAPIKSRSSRINNDNVASDKVQPPVAAEAFSTSKELHKKSERNKERKKRNLIDQDEEIIACPRNQVKGVPSTMDSTASRSVERQDDESVVDVDVDIIQDTEASASIFTNLRRSVNMAAFTLPMSSKNNEVEMPTMTCLAFEKFQGMNPTAACISLRSGNQEVRSAPLLQPAMSMPQEVGPIRRKILMKQFLDDTLSPCTVCFSTLIETLELDFLKTATKSHRLDEYDVVDPGAQIEMVLNDGNLVSSSRRQRQNRKKKKKTGKQRNDKRHDKKKDGKKKKKSKMNAQPSTGRLLPSLPRSKRFVPPTRLDKSTVAASRSSRQVLWDQQWQEQQKRRQRKQKKTYFVGGGKAARHSPMAPIAEEPYLVNGSWGFDNRHDGGDDMFMLLQPSNDSMVPKVGSTGSA
jgi:hypothetical protein